jgi:hypothetical protein
VQLTEKSLDERLGGVFAIAAAVDHFSDAISRVPWKIPSGRWSLRDTFP